MKAQTENRQKNTGKFIGHLLCPTHCNSTQENAGEGDG